ncbi:Soluble starch synthase chloroplastic amyloplastic isoform A [Chlorella sorokiniana]|uniref:starch synthase n=1 Tax=Chlorella sorokiniana TaxID=3076 RepID=A0A2P6TJ71_CHLSO|nr:Soluble starch synthase chloroplastic amyloplastic isoform A [Chlorella sorokiniana]|eukprot:PRW39290.1 Soluble starch synthase chloroplastic amyloplastic isoform A [Chlorella sorokiniana]
MQAAGSVRSSLAGTPLRAATPGGRRRASGPQPVRALKVPPPFKSGSGDDSSSGSSSSAAASKTEAPAGASNGSKAASSPAAKPAQPPAAAQPAAAAAQQPAAAVQPAQSAAATGKKASEAAAPAAAAPAAAKKEAPEPAKEAKQEQKKEKESEPALIKGVMQALGLSASEETEASKKAAASSQKAGGSGSSSGGSGSSGAAAKTAAPAPKPAASGNGGPPAVRAAPAVPAAPQTGAEAKLAVAAKISAARTLARKLAEEKQAALAASRLASSKAVDPEAAKQMIQAAENEVAEMAREAARADAMARAARKAEAGDAQQLELQRLKAENEALQQLLVQLAADRQAAEAKLREVKERYSNVPAEVEAAAAELAASRDVPAAIAAEFKAEAPPPAPPKPAVPEVVPSAQQLARLAEAARTAGKAVFTLPDSSQPGQGVPVGTTCTIFYDRSKGPLPGNANVALKVGFNKWESMEVLPMQRSEELAGNGAGGDWWQVELALPELLSRIDFVTMDSNSGAVDNNGARDFQLTLSGAITLQDLQMKRLQLLEAYERQRMAELQAEEDRIYAEWMAQAQEAAQAARAAYHERRRAQLLEEARAVVAERRGAALQQIVAAQQKDGVFAWPEGVPDAGGAGLLVYNKASGPLRGSSSPVFVHVGYDGWWLKDKRVITMQPLSDAQVQKFRLPAGQWVGAEVPAWATAAMLDYVFTDDRRAIWDNNGGRDFHTLLKEYASGDKLVQLVYEALDAATQTETAHQEELAAKRALDKAHVKAMAGRRRRELRSRVLFTQPITPVAGQPVDIFYNPDETPLRGRPEVFAAIGFNRWTHAEKNVLPLQGVIPGGIGWEKATVQVPPDAHVLDIAFLDSRDKHGGFYDDNKGMDYHVPVVGGTGTVPTLRVVHVAAEMAPIAKEGGLGDVVTALGRAVQEEGHEVEVVLPKYDCINYNLVQDLRMAKDFWMNGVQVKIWKGKVEGLSTTFLEPCNGYFWVGRIYTDIWKDRERFYYWCGCALEYIKHHADARQPDIVHCHDWQSAPVAWLDHGSSKCAFTIHNLNYGADLIGQAMAACEVATTVSPTYAEEVSGHPAIAPHHGKFFGIRNGIDPDIWDPSEDPLLPLGYTAESVVEGKAAAKAELRKRMQLSNADVPIVGCVTRLTHQKGIHLIKHAAWRTMERGGQFVLLGSAPDPKVQAEFNALAGDLARQYPDRARLWFAYDEPLSHLIYAGCDMFLVPSMFEPCGLTQMIAMRYGTIPIVRKTGGLNDTVFDVDHDAERAASLGMEVNGFSFEGMDAPGLDYALNRALSRWFGEREWWNQLSKRAMQMDWSWSMPAQDYLELYYRALKKF